MKMFLMKLWIKFNYNFCLCVLATLAYHAVISAASDKNTGIRCTAKKTVSTFSVHTKSYKKNIIFFGLFSILLLVLNQRVFAGGVGNLGEER